MIKEIIGETLPLMAKEETLKELGDRSTYIGASDISGCIRKVIYSKLFKQEESLETLIRFKRGHLAETFLSDIFSRTRYKWTSQAEIVHPTKNYILAHVDFLFYTSNKAKFGVAEIKTVSSIPSEPYESWVLQVQLQMGLLKLKYPNAEIKGAVLVMDLNSGQMVEFNGMTPDDQIFDSLVKKADLMWELLEKKETENLPTEESNLCVFCAFKNICPNFTGAEVSESIKAATQQYSMLSANIKELEKTKEDIKDQLIDLVSGECNLAFDGNKLVVKKTTSERVDSKLLKLEYPDVYAACTKASEYTFFRVY
jgi:CRISPR/Cas system-associated exonuclease Cas4 (RecB family)